MLKLFILGACILESNTLVQKLQSKKGDEFIFVRVRRNGSSVVMSFMWSY